jgi:asparagine synthase (glutamine-hydrolysing)
MCGFLGYIGDHPIDDQLFSRLLSLSSHRGPDHAGIYRKGPCIAGFNRLSIQDLSPHGHQPMTSEDGQRILVFNGEVYNHLQLREQFGLQGCKGHGDTETLFQLFNQEGIRSTIKHLDGMFGLAWIDLTERRLYLARDRAGIKPLYYHLSDEGVVFASQLDQVLHFPTARPHELSGENLYDYFALGYMVAPNTVYKDIHQIEPGQLIVIDIIEKKVISRHYYHRFNRTDPDVRVDYIDRIQQSIDHSVREQLVADVPVTSFMSGGIDSPIINAMAIRYKPDLQAFTFKNTFDASLDESAVAETLSKSIGLAQQQVGYEPSVILDLINEHFAGMHEPLGDFSTIPTFLICRALKQQATVVLSGDGGDELFFGYARHRSFFKHGWLFKLPLPLRRPVSKLLMKISGEKVSNSIRSFADAGSAYRDTQTSISREDLSKLLGKLQFSKACNQVFSTDQASSSDVMNVISRADFYGFMQRVLRKVDMMSMIHSVEVRVPYLCQSLIDMAAHYMPRIQSDQDLKAPLKRIFDRYFPGLKPFRRKIGFTLPIEQLMKGPLKDDIIHHTCNLPVYGAPIINEEAFRKYIRQYFNGKHQHHQGVWHLYAWQKWANFQKLQNK